MGCAVPQVMAMATLAEMYGNPKVFTGVVKIRAGLAAMILQDSGDMIAVRRWFSKFALQILVRIDPTDPNAARTTEAAQALLQTWFVAYSLDCHSHLNDAWYESWSFTWLSIFVQIRSDSIFVPAFTAITFRSVSICLSANSPEFVSQNVLCA